MHQLASLLGLLLVCMVLMRLVPISAAAHHQRCCNGKYVVISGATGGTGHAVMARLRRKGATPIILHRRSSFVDDGELHIAVDYDDLSGFPEVFNRFLQQHAIDPCEIEQYYSLHGCGHFDRFSDVSIDYATAYLNANLLSHALLTHYFTVIGVHRIATVSSVCGHFPAQYFTMYGGSKAFLEVLYTSLAQAQSKPVTVVARPAAIQRTHFLQQKEMRKAGIVGTITNLKIIAVTPERVAKVLTDAPSGVHSVGWINFAEDIGEMLPALYIWFVKCLRMPIG